MRPSLNSGIKEGVVYWPAVLFVAVFFVLPEEMKLALTVTMLIVITITRRGELLLSFPRYSGLLMAIPFIGLLAGVLNGHFDSDAYKYFRDVAYYVSPFLVWLLGSAMGAVQRGENGFWTTLYFMAFSSSLSMIVQGLITGAATQLTLGSFNANEMVAYAPILLFISPKSWMWRNEHKKLAWGMALVSLAAIVVSLSRTTLVCLVVLFLAFAVRSFSRFVKTVTVGAGLVILLLAAVSFFSPSVSVEFFGKIGNSLTEISSSQIVWDEASVNTNWRGYEKYCAEVDFENSTTFEKLFGHGDGYLMSVGLYSNLVTGDSGLPFLHNGFFSLLIKCGVVGVVLLLVFYALQVFCLFRGWMRTGYEMTGLAFGMLLCLIVCSYVIEGLFIPSALYFFTFPLAMIFGFEKSQGMAYHQSKSERHLRYVRNHDQAVLA